MLPKIRRLARNHGTEVPSNLLFFDSESHEPQTSPDGRVKRLTLRLWCATAVRFDGRRVVSKCESQGHTPEEFWSFVESRAQKGKPLWMFAHNLNFDLTLLSFWRELEQKRFMTHCDPSDGTPHGANRSRPFRGRLCLEDRPTFLTLMSKSGQLKMIDSGNYWPTKLEKIGESLGVPKLPMPCWSDPEPLWFHYCRNDVRVLQAAIINLLTRWKAEDCGVFRATAPGLAMQNFRHTCDLRSSDGEKLDLVIEPGHASAAIERESYLGGRVEPFFVGKIKGPLYHLDVNSLYPAVMASQMYPRRRLKTMQRPSVDKLAEHMHAYSCVARVQIDSRHETFPIRRNGVQYHAKGRFTTVLCGPELRRALRTNSVASCSEATVYCLAPMFKAWVNQWFARKAAAAAAGPAGMGDLELCKLILNSLSAKWAQKGEFWKTEHTPPIRPDWGQYAEYDATHKVLRRYRNVAGIWQEYVCGEEPEHSFPAISAHITAYAREYMRDLIDCCPAESVFYMATDSLVVNQAGYDALAENHRLDEAELGMLKLKDTHKDAEIFGPNHYRLDNQIVRAGSWAKARFDKSRGWVYDCWQGTRGTIASRPDGSISITEIALSESGATRKGIRTKTGWVEPFVLTGDDDFTDMLPKRPRVI